MPSNKFFRRLLKGLQYTPRAIVTDKLQAPAWHTANYFQRLNTVKADARATARKTHTDRRDAASGRCNGSNHDSKLGPSFSLRHSFMGISIRAATY